MGFFGWLWSHKILIFFIAATSAFGIATIILAVEKSDLETDLDNCKNDSEPGVTTSTAAPPEDMENYKLPKTVIPKAYDLTLYPNLTDGLFKGEVIASVTVQEDVKEIKIHNNGLNITKVDIDGTEAKAEIIKKYELLVITLSDGATIKKGERNITIHYDGDMKNRIVGLYTSSYTNDNGKKSPQKFSEAVLKAQTLEASTLANQQFETLSKNAQASFNRVSRPRSRSESKFNSRPRRKTNSRQREHRNILLRSHSKSRLNLKHLGIEGFCLSCARTKHNSK
ncbi:hypothetical protein ILUMI_20118 [Ignelater luminosus]|uniref:Aminopeptidase N-like N-terminal domain-containing protein n=1 Tax=Ignelater luminosus TaxID=2038154 RepID=A0A8K0CEV1_IGNLU|nr:hypothetical protein ILUMI_20118 [Ignelater luminosus]